MGKFVCSALTPGASLERGVHNKHMFMKHDALTTEHRDCLISQPSKSALRNLLMNKNFCDKKLLNFYFFLVEGGE
jgi:hypothetical protein